MTAAELRRVLADVPGDREIRVRYETYAVRDIVRCDPNKQATWDGMPYVELEAYDA